jgi:hypothetical protein
MHPSSVRLSFLRMKGFDLLVPSYIKAMAILSCTNPESASGPVTVDFPVPLPKKCVHTHSYAHEDSVDQYTGSSLSNRDCLNLTQPSILSRAVQKTIAEVHQILSTDQSDTDSIGSLQLQESEMRSRIGFSNAQLQYLLEHREYLLKDLSRILDAQHQCTPAASSA